MMGATRNRYPFTAAQWEEFEQQALIYKYMLSGVAVPPQLLLSIKRSLDYSSTLIFPSQSTLGGWEGSYGDNEIEGNAGSMSYGWGGRRIDTEPGRCRRTDGKKWRCSKEAHPDSRYCERHMHRGRNRTNSCSRKPVEFHFSTATTNTTPPTTVMSHPTSSSVMPTSLSHDYQNPLLYPSLHHPHSSSSSRPSLATSHHFLDSTLPYTQHNKNHRYLQEMRDMQGETDRAYLHDPYATLKMNPSHHFHFQNLIDKSKEDQNEQQRKGQHCYVLGTDIKSAASSTSIAEVEETGGDQENQNKPFHHFFSDWTPPTRPSRRDPVTCIDDIVDSQSNLASTSTAPLLSISMPLSTQDFFQSKPTPFW